MYTIYACPTFRLGADPHIVSVAGLVQPPRLLFQFVPSRVCNQSPAGRAPWRLAGSARALSEGCPPLAWVHSTTLTGSASSDGVKPQLPSPHRNGHEGEITPAVQLAGRSMTPLTPATRLSCAAMGQSAPFQLHLLLSRLGRGGRFPGECTSEQGQCAPEQALSSQPAHKGLHPFLLP